MNCAFDKEKLTGYYDGELEAAEKAEVERHIASCSECLRELGELKSAAILVKELPRMRAPRSIAEGVTREIQTAGKVHRFSQVRRTVLWAGAVAAAAFVALNVAYFSQAHKDAPVDMAAAARKAGPAPTMANLPVEESRESAQKEEKSARRNLDQINEKEAGRAAEDRKRVGGDESEKKDRQLKNEEFALRGEARPDAPKEKSAAPLPKTADAKAPLAEVPPAAPTATPAKPAAAPVPPPAPFAGKDAAKDAARPAEAPADKAQELKKSAEGLAKSDADPKGKRPAEPQAESAPTNLTIASTQLSKARPVMEETLRKMGVRLPSAPPAVMKGQTAGKSLREESTISVELTDSQISRLRQELEKLGHSRLVVGSPGDPVLAQFGDAGIYRGKKEAASGGAAAPGRKAVEAPKPETAKVESKEKDKDGKEGKEAEDQSPAKALVAAEAGEPKRKVVLHLLEVTVIPDPQPAGDPVKK